MPAEQMGQISRRLRLAFAVTSVVFLFALGHLASQRSFARMETLQARIRALRADAAGHQTSARRLSSADRSDLDSRSGSCRSLHHLPSRHHASQFARPLRAAALPRPSADSASCFAMGLYDLPPRPRSRHRGDGGTRNDSRMGTASAARAFHPGILRHLSSRRPARDAATRSRPCPVGPAELRGLPPLAGRGPPGDDRPRSDQHRHKSQPPMDL